MRQRRPLVILGHGLLLEGLTLYSLRHSFATHYLERGSPADLQALLGHASYTTTERYVRAVSTRVRAGVERLDFGT